MRRPLKSDVLFHSRPSPKAHHGCDLDRLIDISTTTEHPIVIQDDDGNDIGVIDKATLLKGIQGGKA